jgi:hypothetical protein
MATERFVEKPESAFDIRILDEVGKTHQDRHIAAVSTCK